VLELAFQADREAGEPVYRQLERFLLGLVQSRRLAPGERLPASRELATRLGVSRNTVSQAYRALLDEGVLRARVGQGTFVVGASASAAAGDDAPRTFAWQGLVARRVGGIALPRGVDRPGPVAVDFRAGRVDVASLPVAALRRAYGRALAHSAELAEASDPRGFAPLREALARSLVARGLDCGPEQVAVVNGAQQALDLIARTLVDPGDAVAVEQPGYFGAAAAFSACGARLVGVGVDAEGLRVDELARILRARRVKLVYTTPAVQSPTGVALSAPRRRALLALADAYQLPIVEDDYDGELRYGGPPVPALKHLDRAGQVIYVGTFSKALFAGLRMGYLVAARALLDRIALTRWSLDFNSDVVTQAALADLLESGAFERHVRRVRRLYAARRDALLAQLAERMPEGCAWREPAGGNTVWVRMPEDADAAALHAAAAAAGIAYGRGEAFALPDGSEAAEAERHLLLSFARIPEQSMAASVAALADCVRGAQVRRARTRRTGR
jgi:GntR family transcriptional regulator/MocR family aminotransferase